jgi:hypothetical protein
MLTFERESYGTLPNQSLEPIAIAPAQLCVVF